MSPGEQLWKLTQAEVNEPPGTPQYDQIIQAIEKLRGQGVEPVRPGATPEEAPAAEAPPAAPGGYRDPAEEMKARSEAIDVSPPEQPEEAPEQPVEDPEEGAGLLSHIARGLEMMPFPYVEDSEEAMGLLSHVARGATGGLEMMPLPYWVRGTPGIGQPLEEAQQSMKDYRRRVEGKVPWWLAVPGTLAGTLVPWSPASILTSAGRGLAKAAARRLVGPKTSELGLAGRDLLESAAGGALGAAGEGAMLDAADDRDPTENLGFNALLGAILGPAFDLVGAGAANRVQKMREGTGAADNLQVMERGGITTKTFGGEGATTPDWLQQKYEGVRTRQAQGEPVTVSPETVVDDMAEDAADQIALKAIDEQSAARLEEAQRTKRYYETPEGQTPVALDQTTTELEKFLKEGDLGASLPVEERIVGREGQARNPFTDPSDPEAMDLARQLFDVEIVPINDRVGRGGREVVLEPKEVERLGYKPAQMVEAARKKRGRVSLKTDPGDTPKFDTPMSQRGTYDPAADPTPSQRRTRYPAGDKPQSDTIPDAESVSSGDLLDEPVSSPTMTSEGITPPERGVGGLAASAPEFKFVMRPKKLKAQELDNAIQRVQRRALTPEGQKKDHPLWSRLYRGLLRDRNKLPANQVTKDLEYTSPTTGETYTGYAAMKTKAMEEIAERGQRNAAIGLKKVPEEMPRQTGEPRRPKWEGDAKESLVVAIKNFQRKGFGGNPGARDRGLRDIAQLADRAFGGDIVGDLERISSLVAREAFTKGADLGKPRVVAGAGVPNVYSSLDPAGIGKRLDPIFRAFKEEGSDSLKTLVDLLAGPPPMKTAQGGLTPKAPLPFPLRGGHAASRIAAGMQTPLEITPGGGEDPEQAMEQRRRQVVVDLVRAWQQGKNEEE